MEADFLFILHEIKWSGHDWRFNWRLVYWNEVYVHFMIGKKIKIKKHFTNKNKKPPLNFNFRKEKIYNKNLLCFLVRLHLHNLDSLINDTKLFLHSFKVRSGPAGRPRTWSTRDWNRDELKKIEKVMTRLTWRVDPVKNPVATRWLVFFFTKTTSFWFF